MLLVVFTGSGAVLTDWETEAFGLRRKYTAPGPCFPPKLHHLDPEAKLSLLVFEGFFFYDFP